MVVLAVAAMATPVLAEQAPFFEGGPFFDWGIPGPNPGQAGFAPAPFLDNNAASAASVDSLLASRKASNLILAVRVREPLSDPAVLNIFNKYAVQYVFADYENATSVGRTRTLADQIIASNTSKNAYVGNFNYYPNATADQSRPGTFVTGANSYQNRPDDSDFAAQRGHVNSTFGKQYAAPALYPGAPDYKNPAAGNSTAPNIRSALFTMPIMRETYATNGLLGRTGSPTGGSAGYNTAFTGYTNGAQNIPFVTRFNNWGNNSLDSDGNPNASTTGKSTYEFVQNAATPSNGQLLSRGDFQAMILHYRMRGADSVNLFNLANGSVVGYTPSQEQSDIKTGWAATGASLAGTMNGIFSRKNYAFANLTNVIGDQGADTGDTGARSTEVAGAVWSGVFDRSGTTRKLAVLISNLSAVQKDIDLPNDIGGFKAHVSGTSDDVIVAAGTHRMLSFTLSGGFWVLDASGNQQVFLDNNRNGIGIPEPTSMSLLGVGVLGLLARRRRTA